MDLNFLDEKNVNSRGKKTNKFGLFALSITGGATFLLSIISIPFVLPAFRKFCLPFVPATTQQISNVILALKGRSGNLLDIGSGDGRIVIAAANHGFKSVGVELNPWLVLYSRINSFRLGLSKSTVFYCQNLWEFPLNPYQNIVIFGVKEMMDDLTKKFEDELTDTVVVACRFPLPYKVPIQTVGTGIDRVWVYQFKT